MSLSFGVNMARQKKIKSLQIEEKKNEVIMTEERTDNSELEMSLESIQKEIDQARIELEQTKAAIEEKKHELKMQPRREVDTDEQRIVDKQINNINKTKNANEVVEKQRMYDSVMIKGRFMNRRSPGQQVKLTYMKYGTDPVKWYTFKDGGIYIIPRGFVDQINEYYHTPIFVQKQGPQEVSDKFGENSAIAEVDTSNKKYAFVPMEFAA